MKKILLSLTLCFPVMTQAFFSTTDDYKTLEQSTIATVDGDSLDVTITKKIQGNAKITPFFGLPSSAESVYFFVDSTGKPLTKYEGKTRLELLFEEIYKIKNSKLFRFGDPKWPLLFSTESFTITNNEPTITKLKYRLKLDFLDNIFYAELPEQKGKITLVINRGKKIHHFLPICNTVGKIVRTDRQIIWQGQCDPGVHNENFKFYFSEIQNPNLVYKADGTTYVAHFIDNSQFQKYKKIHFVIDKSGSIYGQKWNKSQEIVMELLEKLPPETEIRISFFDEVLKPFNDTFVPNARENQKKLTTYFYTTTPLGTTKYDFFDKIYTDTSTDTLVILLGDFANFSPQDSWWKTAPNNPFVFLSFGENKNLELWSKMTGGFFLPIFETEDFVKSADFWQKFSNIFEPFLAQTLSPKFPNQQEFLPYQYTRYATGVSNFFISRSFNPKEAVSNSTASFLPRIWGQRKLGSLIRTRIRNGIFTQEEQEAFFSIMNTFGIDLETDILEKNDLPISKYFTALEFVENPNIIALSKLVSTPIWFIDHIPYYEKEGLRFAYNFWERVIAQNELRIVPFSPAQKQIFLTFPDIVSQPFSLMDESGNINFCYKKNRCLSTKEEDGRSQALESDKLYWRGYYPNHWANNYIKTLTDKNIYKLTDDGNSLPDEEITRAEFVKMVVEFQYGKEFKRVVSEKLFPDIQDEYLQEVVALLTSKGVINGYNDNTFRPKRILSRAEAVKILLTMNEIGLPPNYEVPTKLPFPDIGGWETFWVITAKAKKMVQGYNNGNFGPHNPLTRGQAAKLIVESFEE